MNRHPRIILIAWVSTLILLLYGAFTPHSLVAEPPQADTFAQVWETIDKHFYDPDFNGINWKATRKDYQSQAKQAQSEAELALVINQMLAELKTSHTHFFTPDDPKYYQIAGVFFPRNERLKKQLKPFLTQGKLLYSGIGIFTQQQDGNTFISAILDGSPASKSDLKVGDRILSVENQPFHPIQSFAGKANQSVQVQVQQTPRADSRLSLIHI